MKRKPLHKSHKMTKWRDTVVTIIDTPRFGRLRACKNCGHEQAETVTGRHTQQALREPCKP